METSNSLRRYIVLSGISFLFLGVVVILCDAMTENEEEESLEQRKSATKFWVGLPYFFLGLVLLYVSKVQKTIGIKSCKVFSIVCFILSLLAVVFEGPDWNHYVNYHNYVCKNGDSATCTKSRNLATLFGSITVAVTMATLLCISNILICNWMLFRNIIIKKYQTEVNVVCENRRLRGITLTEV